MIKKSKSDTSDIALFYEVVKGVTPIDQPDRVAKRAPKPKRFIPKSPVIENKFVFNLDDTEPKDYVAAEDNLFYTSGNIPNKTLRKLTKGQYNLEAKLDLHGLTVDEARETIDIFLQQALEHDARVVLIIHGKGHGSDTPILKNKVNYWLRTIDKVLAFCSAAPFHGGSGATYVLLKASERRSDIE
jgi:DNA-nicking Smr family endonuclease